MDGGTFISYRREDAAGFAGRLCDSLERYLPPDSIFRDVDGLAPGQDFVAAIETRLRQCRVCLAVIGRDWLNARDAEGRRRLDQPDDFVRLELTAALARPEVLVIPVLVEGASMPPADALPSEIRALARRQAVSLRDDTWDADVARLVRSLQPSILPPVPRPTPFRFPALPFRVSLRVALVALGVVLALVVNALRSEDGPEDGIGASTPVGAGDGVLRAPAPAADPVSEAVPPVVGGRDLVIPRVSQVGSHGLIYTLMSARLEPGGSSDTLRVRVALENTGTGGGGVNFWDNTFRLVINGDPIAPNSNLNMLVAGQASAEGEVTFAVPPGTPGGLFRISLLDSKGDIPLDFSARASGAGAPASRAARAIVTSISRDAQPLVTPALLSATLTEVTTRRFANTLRVDTPVRLVNTGGGSILSSYLTLRLVVGDDVLAPTAFPLALLEAGTTLRMAVEFEVPPETTRAVLRATAGDAKADVPLTLR